MKTKRGTKRLQEKYPDIPIKAYSLDPEYLYNVVNEIIDHLNLLFKYARIKNWVNAILDYCWKLGYFIGELKGVKKRWN